MADLVTESPAPPLSTTALICPFVGRNLKAGPKPPWKRILFLNLHTDLANAASAPPRRASSGVGALHFSSPLPLLRQSQTLRAQRSLGLCRLAGQALISTNQNACGKITKLATAERVFVVVTDIVEVGTVVAVIVWC